MSTYAVTVVGQDRPGIVAYVAGAIAQLGGNLEDSSMTLLRGHFAMTLVAAIPGTDPAALELLLHPLRADGLAVSVFALPPQETSEGAALAALLSVHGADRPGIVASATEVIASFNGNITDLSTRLGKDLYVLTADVVFPPTTDLTTVNDALTQLRSDLGVSASVRPPDLDVL